MIPATLIAALAITRLGAIHAAVFGGFAPKSLAQRIEAAKPRAILTASCGIEGSKGPIPYRPLVEGAVEASSFKPEKILIWQRDEHRWNQPDKRGGQRNWQRLMKSARMRGIRAGPVPVKSTDPLYVIYTSGTTGLPKGVVREAGGHAVGLHLSIQYLFDVKGPGDVMFCASDIGWVVGHSYILYAPLLVGATTVLFEGKPVGTPDPGTFWRIVEEHKANALFTAPTAMRAIRKEDPENRFFEAVARRGGLRHLRALFLAGERSEPSIVRLYQDLLTQYAAPGALVIDNWWSSESGSPISGLALRSALGVAQPQATVDDKNSVTPLEIRPGSAGLPMPGFDVRIVNDEGQELPKGTMGNIIMAMPLAPSAFTGLFNDDERFYRSYLKRFDGRWMDTGDAGMIDDDGYIHIMARSDDIINVAAHRFSTGMLFSSISHHHVYFPSFTTRNLTNTSNHRSNRTSHPLAPIRRRSQRSRHPGRPKRTPSFRIHPAPKRHRPSARNTVGGTLPRGERARPRADRGDRVAWRNYPRTGNDPQDAQREDTAEGAARVDREWGPGGVQCLCGGASYRGGWGGCGGCAGVGEGVF